ncbi:MAG TPA: hypothetical protein VGB63_11955 [Pedobacter sp.]|jgi:hypothetical protein
MATNQFADLRPSNTLEQRHGPTGVIWRYPCVAIYFWRMKALTILLVLLSKLSLACVCEGETLNSHYAAAQFVGYVEVKEVFLNELGSEHYYKIRVEPIATFKGKQVKELFVYGSLDGSNWTSCDLQISANSKWIIFAKSNEQSRLATYMCNGSYQIDLSSDVTNHPNPGNTRSARLKSELKILNSLKRTASGINYRYCLYAPKLGSFLNRYQGNNYRKSFGQYQITFDEKLTATSVKVLKSLDRRFDKELEAFILKSEWLAFYHQKVPKNGIYLLGIYHHTTNGEGYLSSHQ